MAFYIPPEKISEIQRSLNIFDVISEFILLKQRGRNFVGLCPFHHEKTPSFTVNVEKQIYKCFGCGEGGTIFNFMMKQESLTFPEAVNILAKKANVRIDNFNIKNKQQGITVLYEANEHATNFFNEMLLKSKEAVQTKDYLAKRLINDDSFKKFRLGYSPNRWDSITNKAKDWNISAQLLEKSGLIIKRQDNGFYDRFRNRLMFPIIDSQNRPIGFGARALDDALPKYLNSPETPVFNKSKTLYGINLAKDSIIKKRKVLLMEGYTDVIMAHQCGIDWSIAILGTALTREHVRLLKRYCEKAILVFDADTAGQKSSDRNLDIFIEEDFEVSIVLLPENYDPCDFLVKEGAQKFLEQVEKAYDFFSFKIKLSENKWDMSTVSGKASAIDDILSTVVKIPNTLKRDLTVKRVAEEMSIEEKELRKHLSEFLKKGKFGRNQAYDKKSEAPNKPKLNPDQKVGKDILGIMKSRKDLTVEKAILGIMISRNDLIGKVESNIGFDSFKYENLRNIAEKIFEIYSKRGHVEHNDIFPMLNTTEISGDLIDVIFDQSFSENSVASDQNQSAEKKLNECIRYKKQSKIKEGRRRDKEKISALNKSEGPIEEENNILTKFHRKNIDFHSIKNSE